MIIIDPPAHVDRSTNNPTIRTQTRTCRLLMSSSTFLMLVL